MHFKPFFCEKNVLKLFWNLTKILSWYFILWTGTPELSKPSNGISHMQNNVAVSEMQRLERNALARACTEIFAKSVNEYSSI